MSRHVFSLNNGASVGIKTGFLYNGDVFVSRHQISSMMLPVSASRQVFSTMMFSYPDTRFLYDAASVSVQILSFLYDNEPGFPCDEVSILLSVDVQILHFLSDEDVQTLWMRVLVLRYQGKDDDCMSVNVQILGFLYDDDVSRHNSDIYFIHPSAVLKLSVDLIFSSQYQCTQLCQIAHAGFLYQISSMMMYLDPVSSQRFWLVSLYSLGFFNVMM